MPAYNLVAVYRDHATADDVRRKLLAHGIPTTDIRLGADGAREDVGYAQTPGADRKSEGGFLDWLFGTDDVSDDERRWYQNLGERTAVSVRVDEGEADRVRDILDGSGPVDMGVETETGHTTSASHASRMNSGSPDAAYSGGSGQHDEPQRGTAHMGTSHDAEEGEQVIPLPKEQLHVGKRATETRHRVRTYMVERPVEKTIPLRDERTVIERRPATGDPASMPTEPGAEDREYEVVERREEPVIDKKAATTEEAVIRKDVRERTETVRDSVRETEIEDDAETEADPATGRRDDSGMKR